MEKTFRSFNVTYEDPQNCVDETQLDVEDGEFDVMMTELVQLFSKFCKETYNDDPCWIIGVEEVPYDGEEE